MPWVAEGAIFVTFIHMVTNFTKFGKVITTARASPPRSLILGITAPDTLRRTGKTFADRDHNSCSRGVQVEGFDATEGKFAWARGHVMMACLLKETKW